MAFRSTPQTPRQEAEAKLAAKQFKAQEAKRAFSEYEATARAVDANTARLKALRLAKEAADAATAAQAPPPAKPVRRKSSSTK
jgi:hypothetical protein